MIRLNSFLNSSIGNLFRVVVDLDFAIQSRMGVPLSTLPYTEFIMLKLLAEERNRWQIEESRRRR